MFWEVRFWKGIYKVRLFIKGRGNGLVQALVHIPEHSKFREIKQGEYFITPVRLLYRNKRKK